MKSRIIFLTSDSPVSSDMDKSIDNLIRQAGELHRFIKINIGRELRIPNGRILSIKPKTQGKLWVEPGIATQAAWKLGETIKLMKPGAILCANEGMLKIISGDPDATLAKYALSLFWFEGIPVIISQDTQQLFSNDYNHAIFTRGIQRVTRFADGKPNPEPRFNLMIAETVEEVLAIEQVLVSRPAFASDIETTGTQISVLGFSAMLDDGVIQTYVIPIINPQKLGGCHWTEEEEIIVRQALQRIYACEATKIFFNGSYDTSYLLKELMPVKNWLADGLHAWHAMYAEMPKTLAFVTSMLCDHYQYWKDEGKGDASDKLSLHETIIIQPRHVFVSYCQYNGLDCHWLLIDWIYLSRILENHEKRGARYWLNNYHMEMMDQLGPCMEMSMRGMAVDQTRQAHIRMENANIALNHLQRVRDMTDMPEFNPYSGPQVETFLYDELGATPPTAQGAKAAKRKSNKRSVDKTAMKKVKGQHPFFAFFIQEVAKYKEFSKLSSDFGEMKLWRGRFMTSLSPAGTNTGRYSSKQHSFWVGTNGQNLQKRMREMLVADPGCVIIERDFSQSDAVFVAFECEDENYMNMMMSGRDAHSYHAANIFQKSEAEILAGKAAKAEWVEHPETGVRQITKKVTHGSNYIMGPVTMIEQMTEKSVIAAAITLGYNDAMTWDESKLKKFVTDVLQAGYFRLYPKLKPWMESLPALHVKCGGIIDCFGGLHRKFFGKAADGRTQRAMASFKGQGGTAGNVRRAMLHMYYHPTARKLRQLTGFRLHLQVHDSIVVQVALKWALLVNLYLQRVMEAEIEWKGRKFYVRTDGEMGISWGAGLTKVPKDGSIAGLLEAENKIREKYGQPKLSMANFHVKQILLPEDAPAEIQALLPQPHH